MFTVFFLFVFIRLGFWQLDRAEEKETQRNEQAAADGAPPVSLYTASAQERVCLGD